MSSRLEQDLKLGGRQPVTDYPTMDALYKRRLYSVTKNGHLAWRVLQQETMRKQNIFRMVQRVRHMLANTPPGPKRDKLKTMALGFSYGMSIRKMNAALKRRTQDEHVPF